MRYQQQCFTQSEKISLKPIKNKLLKLAVFYWFKHFSYSIDVTYSSSFAHYFGGQIFSDFNHKSVIFFKSTNHALILGHSRLTLRKMIQKLLNRNNGPFKLRQTQYLNSQYDGYLANSFSNVLQITMYVMNLVIVIELFITTATIRIESGSYTNLGTVNKLQNIFKLDDFIQCAFIVSSLYVFEMLMRRDSNGGGDCTNRSNCLHPRSGLSRFHAFLTDRTGQPKCQEKDKHGSADYAHPFLPTQFFPHDQILSYKNHNMSKNQKLNERMADCHLMFSRTQ